MTEEKMEQTAETAVNEEAAAEETKEKEKNTQLKM